MPQVLDFVAQTYTAHSKPLNAARCVNFFAESEQQDARSKSPVGIWGSPGISPFADTGAGPVTALHQMNDVVYAISGNGVFTVGPNGQVESVGTQGAQDFISIDDNGVQMVWVDGLTGWSYQPGVGVLQITDPNFFPSNTVTYFDGYFCFVRNGTKEFFLSPLFGVVPFDAAQFASKEATSDLLLAIANSHEQLYLFGQERIEVWYDAGNPVPAFPFQRSDGAIIQRGTQAPLSIILEDNTLFFLGDDGMYYRANGFVPERISNHAVENAWAGYPTLADCKALIYTVFGHKMLTLTFPTAMATWVCDLSTRRWHERESWLGSSAGDSIGRWRGNCAIHAFGRVLIGDSVSGQIGQLNFNAYTEFGDTMRGLLDGPHIHMDRRRVFMKRFEIDVESGEGLPQSAVQETLTYTMHGVTITQPTVLQTALPLQGATPAGIATALFSVWLLVPDGGASTGLRFGGSGLTIAVANDGTTTPQIIIAAHDQLGAQIVLATYDFTNWVGWVNLLVSLDTAGHRLQVVASTLSGSVFSESFLSPVSIVWGSVLPLANTAAWLAEPV